MKKIILFLAFVLSVQFSMAQAYKVGDKASDFRLKNVDGQWVSMADYPEAKGFIIVFTCNHCPYSRAYETRINNIAVRYKPLGYQLIAINPNDSTIVAADSYSKMQLRAKARSFHFPYLLDDHQRYAKIYGATRTPQVFLLQKQEGGLIVRYTGAIDDNYEDPMEVSQRFLQAALNALIHGKQAVPNTTKAIGCSIKYAGASQKKTP